MFPMFSLFSELVFVSLHEFQSITVRIEKETAASTWLYDCGTVDDLLGLDAISLKLSNGCVQIIYIKGKVRKSDRLRLGHQFSYVFGGSE